jgi:predicted MPP superfamily phosphohydrolase
MTTKTVSEPAADLNVGQPVTRRRFLKRISALAAAGGAGAVYVRWFEPHALHVHTVAVPAAEGSKASGPPIRFVHLSDFHASSFVSFEFIDEAISLALAQRPDGLP